MPIPIIWGSGRQYVSTDKSDENELLFHKGFLLLPEGTPSIISCLYWVQSLPALSHPSPSIILHPSHPVPSPPPPFCFALFANLLLLVGVLCLATADGAAPA